MAKLLFYVCVLGEIFLKTCFSYRQKLSMDWSGPPEGESLSTPRENPTLLPVDWPTKRQMEDTEVVRAFEDDADADDDLAAFIHSLPR
ncbi:unnamed protein product [Protopolystoma xenopodis]|uniref:Uncharacterized protein n=1 Tax=Protopolystoma xenopodis TaxID=117903 RepID=A0A448WNZ1_9PLAT|nr:unnamed protein product [Protopolystoma xenopodis]